MSDAPRIIVAKAKITDHVELDETGERALQVHVGQPFSIRFAYRIYEVSKDEDTWKAHLHTKLENGDELQSNAIHRDTRFVNNDEWCHLRVDHLCAEKGVYKLEFDAGANLARREWGSGAPPAQVDEANVTGTIEIHAV